MSELFKLAAIHPDPSSYTEVLEEIRTRRDEFAALRYIPDDTVRKLQDIGVYRAFVPERLGGDALSPANFCRMIEDISAADASTGWVASFGMSPIYLAALPTATFDEVYGNDPNTVFAGAIYPPKVAKKVEGGYLVNGQWAFVSGIMGATLAGAGIKVEDARSALPRMAIMPKEKVTVVDTWDTIGLAATGSHSIRVENVVVAPEWTFVRGSKSEMDDRVFRYPGMAIASQVLAVVALGAAREALAYLYATAGRESVTGAPKPGKRPYLQAEFAKAYGVFSGARSMFYDTIEEAWERLEHDDALDTVTQTRLRLICTQAAQGGAEAARRAFLLGGIPALNRGNTLGQCMIDSACVAQHAFFGEGTWTAAGATFFGEPTIPGYP